MSDEVKKSEGPDSTNEERRRAVRKLLAGGGIVASGTAISNAEWKKPVIDTLIVPSHGQMTVGVTTTSFSTTTT